MATFVTYSNENLYRFEPITVQVKSVRVVVVEKSNYVTM